MHQIWKCKVSNISNRLRSKPLDKYACCLSLSLPPSKFLLAGVQYYCSDCVCKCACLHTLCAGRVVGREIRLPHFSSSSPFSFHSAWFPVEETHPSPFSIYTIWDKANEATAKSKAKYLLGFPFRNNHWALSWVLGEKPHAETVCPAGTLAGIFVFKWTPSLHRVPRKKPAERKQVILPTLMRHPAIPNSKVFNEISLLASLLPQHVKTDCDQRGCISGWKEGQFLPPALLLLKHNVPVSIICRVSLPLTHEGGICWQAVDSNVL